MEQCNKAKKKWIAPQVKEIELTDALTSVFERTGLLPLSNLQSRDRPLRVASRSR